MGVGAGLYTYDVVVKKFTFAISSPDEFLFWDGLHSVFGLWRPGESLWIDSNGKKWKLDIL